MLNLVLRLPLKALGLVLDVTLGPAEEVPSEPITLRGATFVLNPDEAEDAAVELIEEVMEHVYGEPGIAYS